MMRKIAGFIVLFLALIGILVVGVGVHEIKHYLDLKDQENVELLEICFLNINLEQPFLDKDVGYVSYYNYGDSEAETSEIKATIIGFVVIVILTIILLYHFFTHLERQKKII
jgi:TRAP-type mannitol/chloroaromatic compound transport system permease large subunit